MKQLILIFSISVLTSFSIFAKTDQLEVGKKIPNWETFLKNSNISSAKLSKNKVLIVNYIDPREKDENKAATIAVKNAIVDGRLSLKHLQAIGIVDCNASWAPNFLIQNYANKANKKVPELDSIMLFDIDGILDKNYGYGHDTGDLNTVVLVDKQGMCRAIYNNKMTKEEITDLVDLAIKLQHIPQKQTPENKKISPKTNKK